ncbi:TLC domain-containing protein 3A-like [Toxotes jaculatrix]|uniref:TLC domain-containing protein 3A-like n=1 Tax=Toxotes jaculatrix TaxID=941984 RepID=UPI001B3ABC63|nr:TLC domain-containing protein 3A-like [Toxotes jaculatrix]
MSAALACGAVVFPGLFYTFRKILKSTFTHWTDADVVSVSERLVSAIHASLATAAGVTVVTSCKDVMTDSHWLVNQFVLFGAPYMAHDIYAMYLSHFYTRRVKGHASAHHSLQTLMAFLSKDWTLVLHHLALLLVFMPITLFFRRGLGDFFVGCLFNAEFSTPFISIGKILIQLGLDNTRLHRINGIVVLLSFFMCRILVFPYMYWMYGRQFGIPLHRVPFHLPLQCNVGNLVILAPQIYWFILLLKKANRLYLRQKRG